MAEKVLSLSTTEFDRPVILIDGAEFQMRAPEELTVAMQRALEKAAETREQSSLEEDDESLSKQVRGVMVSIPDEVLAKLSLMQKVQILRVFTDRLALAFKGPATSPTPASSASPAVSDSSAAH